MRSVAKNLYTRLVHQDGLFAFGMALACVIYGNSLRVTRSALRHFLEIRITVHNAAFAFLFMIGWTAVFKAIGLYKPEGRSFALNTMRTVLGCLCMSGILAGYLVASHTTGPTYTICLEFLICSVVYEITRLMIRRWMVNRNPLLVLVVGSGRRAGKAWRELRTRYHGSVQLVGFVDDRSTSEMGPDIADRYLGTIDDLEQLLLKNVVDELLIALPTRSCYDDAQRAIAIAEEIGVRAVYMQDMYDTRLKNDRQRDSQLFNDLVPFHEDYIVRQELKRILDIVGAALGLILLSPIFIVVAMAIKLSSKGSVFFLQERYGYRRRCFTIYKFRTMVHNAAELMEGLEAANEATGPIFKIRDDPRVTRLGKILRATSIDELPQLWNVLTGTMSLVGPRPMSVRDVSHFSEATLMRRFTVKPGMTGLWQVSGRHILSFEKWVEMDFSYIDRWSLALDLEILAKTLPVVFRKTGGV
jgi:exopolysaccharide biosynthesis polyprenyl glycosylphosphotransferase